MKKITMMDLCDERYADAAAKVLERQREEWLEQGDRDLEITTGGE